MAAAEKAVGHFLTGGGAGIPQKGKPLLPCAVRVFPSVAGLERAVRAAAGG